MGCVVPGGKIPRESCVDQFGVLYTERGRPGLLIGTVGLADQNRSPCPSAPGKCGDKEDDQLCGGAIRAGGEPV